MIIFAKYYIKNRIKYKRDTKYTNFINTTYMYLLYVNNYI